MLPKPNVKQTPQPKGKVKLEILTKRKKRKKFMPSFPRQKSPAKVMLSLEARE